MEYKNLKKCLQKYSDFLLRTAQSEMPDRYELKRNIRFDVRLKDSYFEVTFVAPEYWKYVEYGRNPGKIPPLNTILEWVKTVPITPKPLKNGTVPTPNQLAYVIARSIGKKGVKGKYFLKHTLQEQKDFWEDAISEAISLDISENTDEFLSPLATSQSIIKLDGQNQY